MKSKAQKIFWSENIRFLRNRKKMSQESLAASLDISRSKLNAHENGHTVNPPVEDLLRASDYFKISIDSLLKIELAKLGDYNLHQLESGNDVYMRGTKIRVLAISVDNSSNEHIEYVPIKAKAGYAAGYSDPEFIASLPKYSFPNLPKNATYRMFPTIGDSMLPIPEGSDILTRYVQDWNSLKAATACIVIFKNEQDFVFKNVTVQADGNLLLASLNTDYKPYTAAIENVLEIWQFVRYISNEIPATTDLQELKKMIVELGREVRKENN
ncbi:MAG: LexA family transcriptional regulator [Chitinophagaceae bacterium]|nr:LexA family transcriptional regulator [Chitinophagaceae bacterium]